MKFNSISKSLIKKFQAFLAPRVSLAIALLEGADINRLPWQVISQWEDSKGQTYADRHFRGSSEMSISRLSTQGCLQQREGVGYVVVGKQERDFS